MITVATAIAGALGVGACQ
nr:smalltalk protein [Bacteroides cellulosilyticus]